MTRIRHFFFIMTLGASYRSEDVFKQVSSRQMAHGKISPQSFIWRLRALAR